MFIDCRRVASVDCGSRRVTFIDCRRVGRASPLVVSIDGSGAVGAVAPCSSGMPTENRTPRVRRAFAARCFVSGETPSGEPLELAVTFGDPERRAVGSGAGDDGSGDDGIMYGAFFSLKPRMRSDFSGSRVEASTLPTK